MWNWKKALLNFYYYGTYPVRMRHFWEEATKDHAPAIVLYYHRIADDRATPWTTSNAMFFRQMRWLRKRFEFVSLSEVQKRVARGTNSRPCVSITFDDGYSDNCQKAVPWLIKERIPCTYFVTLRNLLKEEPFSHDLVWGRPLAVNTLEQVRAMAAAGIEIGAHGYTHADLGAIADARLLDYEVSEAKKELQAAVGQEIRYFAFPFGHPDNLNVAVFEIAKQVGYVGVCTAYGGYNFPGDDPFHIQRISAGNDMIHLKNWSTLDPRKLRTMRFEYKKTRTNEAVAVGSAQPQAVKSKSLAPSP
jgi:peptidoglycan/xylan/chitin deacetylase (PgdA/CDA1 family)